MAVHSVTVEKTIQVLLNEKKYQTLKDILVTMEPADIAAVFEELDEERMPLLFRLLPKETAAETFAELEPEGQELLILVTELTLRSTAARFIARYGCDAYFRHNKNLLFYERKTEIGRAIDDLQLDDEP